MIRNRLEHLYEAYMKGQLDADGKQELWALLTDPALEATAKVLMDKHFESAATGMPAQSEASADAMFADIINGHKVTQVRKLPAKRRWWAAAAAILVLGGGLYLASRSFRDNTPVAGTLSPIMNDALPGREGAVLTLSDGSKVALDSVGNAVVGVQGGTQLSIRNGQLFYTPDASASAVVAYNTVTTPRGRQFSIALPDGSRAWMNAVSSIRYPVAFTGRERRVEVTGEVYFEVEKNAEQPFFVQVTGGAEIQVLGTNFNINAYADEEAIRTTLLEGSVKVLAEGAARPVLLKPGQQASLQRNTARITVGQADEEQVMAWKHGNFNFDHADIETIMRQIARWYDLEVTYNSRPEKKFSGTIPRNINASQVFSILESTNNVHFKIEGNRVTVAP